MFKLSCFSRFLGFFVISFLLMPTLNFAQSSLQSDIQKALLDLCGSSMAPLKKTGQTQASSYSNATFNMSYTAPTGWSFPTPTPGSLGVSFSVTNPLYLASIRVGSYKRDDPDASAWLGPRWCYITSAYCFSQTSTQVPYVYYCSDTTYSNTGLHFAWQKIKYLNDHSLIECDYCMQNGSYTLICSFVTTVADYNLNYTEYEKHVFALNWYSATLAKTNNDKVSFSELIFQNKQASFTFMREQQARLDALNLKGQIVGTLYNGIAKGTTSVSTENTLKANQTYILRLQTEKNQSTLKIQNTH